MSPAWHVLGAGSIGSLWAAHLARALGTSGVALVMKQATWAGMGGPSCATINVENPEGRSWSAEVKVEHVRAVTPIKRMLVATKATDACRAVADVAERLQNDAVILLLCNGMGVYEEITSKDELSRFSYLLGATTHGVYSKGRLDIVHAGFGQTWIGAPRESSTSRAGLAPAATSLNLTGLNVAVENCIEDVLWRKLAANASLNGITALMGCRNGAVVESVWGLKLVEDICLEISGVLKAGGLLIPEDELLNFALDVAHKNAFNYSSMYQDISAGQPTEVDYINGFVITQGADLGIETPINGVIHSLIKLREEVDSKLYV
ncbi:unnamed protein product [Discosporangium mesarthrocarpum]